MDTGPINVNMLGEFAVYSLDGTCVISDSTNRSKKLMTLLKYIIANRGRGVPLEELTDIIWSGEDAAKQGNTLKTLLHRARAAIEGLSPDGEDVIICRRRLCAWNSTLETEVDAERFESLVLEAENGGENRLEPLLKAVELYKGDYLGNSPDDIWAVPTAERLRVMYLKAVREASGILEAQGDDAAEEKLLRKAVSIIPFDDGLHIALIRSLLRQDKTGNAMLHFNYVNELYMDKFGIDPSPELTDLYPELVRMDNAPEQSLWSIRAGLQENDGSGGAFFCEYAVFRDIYRLEARAASRNGGIVQLALITVKDTEGKLGRKQFTGVMGKVAEVVRTSLRECDVMSRYSVSQYVVMLSGARVEDGSVVLERVRANFRRTYPHSTVELSVRSLPLEPLIKNKVTNSKIF